MRARARRLYVTVRNTSGKEKQKQLQDLANQVLTPEMKDMMKKLQDMLDKLNKDNAMDQLQNQKMNNDELQKELDRMLSLFKKLEFEQKMEATKDKLDKLSEEQKKKISESLKGKSNVSWKGRKHSKETIDKMSEGMRRARARRKQFLIMGTVGVGFDIDTAKTSPRQIDKTETEIIGKTDDFLSKL